MSCGVPTADTVWRKRIGSDAQLASFFAEMWHTRSSTRSNRNTFLMASHGFLSEAFAIRCRDLLKIFLSTYLLPCSEKTVHDCAFQFIWLDLLTISTLVNTKQRDYCNIFSRISTGVGILTPLGQGCHFCCWTLLAACLPSSCPAIAPWGCQFVANHFMLQWQTMTNLGANWANVMSATRRALKAVEQDGPPDLPWQAASPTL